MRNRGMFRDVSRAPEYQERVRREQYMEDLFREYTYQVAGDVSEFMDRRGYVMNDALVDYISGGGSVDDNLNEIVQIYKLQPDWGSYYRAFLVFSNNIKMFNDNGHEMRYANSGFERTMRVAFRKKFLYRWINVVGLGGSDRELERIIRNDYFQPKDVFMYSGLNNLRR